MKIEFLPVKTRIIHPPKDDISDILDSLEIKDGDIVFISSKVLGISEGRCFKVAEHDKTDLIKAEVERYLPYVNNTGDFHVNLTVNQNILIPSGGIDESNANGYYVLWPKNPDESCRRIREKLMTRTGVKNLGVVATDSHTTGGEPLEDIRGKEDLFGRAMHVTQIDKIDPLTSMAVAIMGESSEAMPIVILRDYKDIKFSDTASMKDFKIDPDFDLYSPLIKVLPINDK